MDQEPAPSAARSQPETAAPRLYVIDDDRSVLDVVDRLARQHGFEVLVFGQASDALAALASCPPDVALVDLRMPGEDGLETLAAIKRRAPLCDVVLMTGYGTIESAVEAVKLGAADYLSKPFDLARLGGTLSALRSESARRRAVDALEADLISRAAFHGLHGRSPAMLDLFSLIRRIGPHFTTALVTGETGVGKEVVARALHAAGGASERPFITVSCATAAEGGFEAELLARVGDDAIRAGHDVLPGIVFLDEIGELTPAGQARLLRVLESSEIRRFGASGRTAGAVRIIASTNRTLERDVQAGRFRSDLYFRLHIVELAVPPLRERREDVALLARVFAREFAAAFGKAVRGLTPDAERALSAYDWPGNVRELKNAIGRACMLIEHEWVDAPDLAIGGAAWLRAPAGPVRPMQEVEREQVVRALEETSGNKKEAARRLGISRRAFYRRLEKYGLYTPQAEGPAIQHPAA